MKKLFLITLAAGALVTAASAQTAVFNFNGAASQSTDMFTSNGISLDITGLMSATSLNQNQSTTSLTATTTNIVDQTAREGGIGTGPFSDGELRNGAGTPSLSGASLLEISNITTPKGTAATGLSINFSSVDTSTNEGWLVYGSKANAANGTAQLTLLGSGKGTAGDVGTFDVTKSLLSKYSNFYVTADNSFYSSVLLGNGTKVKAQPVPEPASLAGIGLLMIPFFRKRKKASV
jgi:hypothetical protein